MRRAYKEGQNRALFSKTQVSIGSQLGILQDGFGDSKIEWRAVENVGKTDNHLFIFVSAVTAYVIPRDAFASEDAFVTFAEKLTEKVSLVAEPA